MSATAHRPDPEQHWSVADYRALDDERRCELIEGALHEMSPAPSFAHQRIVMALAAALFAHVREHALGECVQAPCDVVLAPDTVVQPDIVFVAAERFATLFDGHGLSGAPDLVVEVLSPRTSARDRTTKRALYAKHGVAWLVLVDPEARTAEVFALRDGQWVLTAAAANDETLRIGLFPQLEIPLGSLWLPTP